MVKRSLRSFAKQEEGVTAVEFAVLAPTFLLLVMGVIEFGMVMMVYNVMESATAISSRLGKTGYAAPGVTREQTIINAITARAGSLIDPKKLVVTSKFYKQYDQIGDPEPFIDSNGNGIWDNGEAYTDINGNGKWDPDMGTSGYGSAGDVVVYTITYPWSITTPLVKPLIGDKLGHMNIITHAVVKNEPYN